MYWYGENEKLNRKSDIAYVKKNFPDTKFRMISQMDHGEYCMVQSEKFAMDLIKISYKV
ncbi:hypothetical protein CLOSBL3_10901 [Clostridiaceae bacterium BL-3]|nr:hypothetical protein CLOSBL3_10901 [Clostridiaceae bacterium BL-3]